MKHILLSASLLMPLSSIASAQSADVSSGNFLYNPCKNAISDRNFSDYREVFNQGICAGRVAALLNVAQMLTNNYRFCPPESVNTSQAIRVIIAYFDANPNRLHERFTLLANQAFRQAWPCP